MNLHGMIQERLIAETDLDPVAMNLIDAAVAGETEFRTALARLAAAEAPPARAELQAVEPDPPGVFLSSVRVAGFRGVGAECRVDVVPGPGLTFLIGRNGSGKSSFAEAIETLLTGDSRRWSDRSKDWRDGWKNLHAKGSPFIAADFTVEGGKPITIRRAWTEGAQLEQSELRIRRGSEEIDNLTTLGWTEALDNFRPFLCYSELGELLGKQSELYDELRGILGLEQLADAIKRVQNERKPRDERLKRAKDDCKRLLQRLEQLSDDPRAQRCRDAMKPLSWKLAEVESVVLGEHTDERDDGVRLLTQLAQLSVPSLNEVAGAVSELRRTLAEAAQLAGSSAEQSARLATTLEHALRYCGNAADDCPVCGATLPSDWIDSAQRRLKEARELADHVRTADNACKGAAARLRAHVTAVPAVLTRVDDVQLSRGLLEAWRAWADAPADLAALCEHAETKILELHAEHGPFQQQARERVEKLQSAWRPIATELAVWLQLARTVESETSALTALKRCEEWLKDADDYMRDLRFKPIAAESQTIWSELRQQSSVDLQEIKLDGKGPKRHVALNVTVDNREGVAVGVMSQGELNALALSLFLPRMMLAESPFRFLVIDDPVQAMDSHKVDGLARVLDRVAKTRQVIVLSHDIRLLEAIRRLQIDATVLEVQRRSDSAIELYQRLDPVERHFKDALSISKDETAIGPKLAARVVPGFCRLAVEAACVEAIRRRRYLRGALRDDVERTLEETQSVHPLVALALFDDDKRAADVYTTLNNKQKGAADTLRALKEGAHDGFRGDLEGLVSASRKLAKLLREQP